MKLTTGMIAIVAVVALFAVWLMFRRRSGRQKTEIMMSRKYIDGLESERSRFARELHDGVCNDLLALGMNLKSGKSGLAETLSGMENIRGDLRRISHEMMPPSFSHANLDEILADYIRHVGTGSVKFSYRSSGSSWASIPSGVSYELYRITQEAVANIIRHSGATEASVLLSLDVSGNLSLEITDNGKGGAERGDGGGIGIRTIRDRVASIGGTAAYEAGPGGCKLIIKTKIHGYAG